MVQWCGHGCVWFCGRSVRFVVSVPERSKGVDSSSTVFALVGSNPTADNVYSVSWSPPLVVRSLPCCVHVCVHACVRAFGLFGLYTSFMYRLPLSPPSYGAFETRLYSPFLTICLRRHLVPTHTPFLAPWTISQPNAFARKLTWILGMVYMCILCSVLTVPTSLSGVVHTRISLG